MEHDFWHQRWAAGRLGFHQQKVNSRLIKFWHAAAPVKGEKVLAPLCGKSLDMLWLAGEGHPVIGVEVSDVACRDFFVENELPYQCAREDGGEDGAPFVRYTGGGDGGSGGIELWCGDFFDLKPADLRGVRVVYDRASLIALPEGMRAAYAAHLAALLPPGARVFLISMDYDENKMKGPPFSVPEDEVRGLFADEFSVEIITQSAGPDIVGNLAARGLDTLNEKVYLMRRNRDSG